MEKSHKNLFVGDVLHIFRAILFRLCYNICISRYYNDQISVILLLPLRAEPQNMTIINIKHKEEIVCGTALTQENTAA